MKIGIVGMGSIGRRHYSNIAALGHDVRAYDPAQGHYRGYERQLYDWCDAAVIATPSYCHEAGLRACVERGKHVFIEKPISTSIGQLPELLHRADEKDLVVMMGNNLRFHPCVRKAREWLGENLLGNILWAHFTCAQQSTKPLYLSDGIILNTGSHEVDLARHLLGYNNGTVECASARLTRSDEYLGGDDIADFVVTHRNGTRSSFHLDFVTTKPVREFRIVGTDGMIDCDLIARRMILTQPDPKLPDVIHVNNYASPTHSFDQDYVDEMQAFISLIEGIYVSPAASGYDGLDTLHVLLDVRKKAGL